MDDLAQAPQQQPEQFKSQVITQPKKQNLGKWLSIILAILLVAALAFLAWYWMQAEAEKKKLNDEKSQLQTELSQLKATNETNNESAATDGSCKDTPSAALKTNIKAALDSKNTAAFATYTSNPVNFVIAASEFGKSLTPDEAATSLDYTHVASGPWDFSLPAAMIASYDAGFYTDYFDTNTYVGRAASGMVAAFDFDCDGKISKIFVAADDDLLL